MKRCGWLFFLLLAFTACEAPPKPRHTTGITVGDTEKFITANDVSPNEEYVMITTAVNLPLYLNHDQKAFLAWGKSLYLALRSGMYLYKSQLLNRSSLAGRPAC